MRPRTDSVEPLVSVVIPIYNQARYLASSIESVMAQTYWRHEIIVVDDGSDDDPVRVAARYPPVRLVRQGNQGCSAARNRAVRESLGASLVFLDADDRLLPGALERGVAALALHPDAAFVFGLARRIGIDGTPLPECQTVHPRGDLYEALLQRCFIWHPAAVMCRRGVFDHVGFETSMRNCADYFFYLTVARRWPIFGYDELVSEYRKHDANNSAASAEMIRHLTRALREQARSVSGVPAYKAARRVGLGNSRRDYYLPAIRQTWRRWKSGQDRGRALRDTRLLLGITPAVLPRLAAGHVYRWARRRWAKHSSQELPL